MPAERYPTARAASTAIAPIRRAQLLVDRRRRRLLDELLVTALDRAVALAEMDHRAVLVGEDLHLDVARILEVALDVDRVVGEIRLAFAACGLVGALDLLGRGDDLEAFPAASGRGLDGDRPAVLVPEPAHLVRRVHGLGRAGNDRDAGGAHRLPRGDLRAHQLHRLGGRADPDQAGGLDGAREVRRSRRGTRSRGEPPLRPSAWPRRGSVPDSGSSRRACPGRRGRPRPRRRRAASRGRPRSRSRPSRCRARAASGRCERRSLRGWRRESS